MPAGRRVVLVADERPARCGIADRPPAIAVGTRVDVLRQGDRDRPSCRPARSMQTPEPRRGIGRLGRLADAIRFRAEALARPALPCCPWPPRALAACHPAWTPPCSTGTTCASSWPSPGPAA